MPSLRTHLTAATVALVALSPAAAMAAGSHAQPQLGGNPQMRLVDAHHATLNFASDRLAKNAYGGLDAKITFVNGARVSDLKPVGTHGNDIRYTARVSSQHVLRDHEKFTVSFRLGDSAPVKRFVKLFLPGEHG